MTRLLAVLGTRPEAIKLAPVIRAASDAHGIEVLVASTGQHGEVLDDVLGLFGITPDFSLDVMRHGQSLAALSGRVLTAVEQVLAESEPDIVMVQGDTTSAAMAALASFYAGVPVWHVEAGLRTSDPSLPFPEEMNRRLIGRIAAMHLAPTPAAEQNLLREGVDPAAILVTGNTGIDGFLQAQELHPGIGDTTLARFAATTPLMVATTHRRENWGEGIRSVARAMRRLADAHPDLHIVHAAHPNPAVRADIDEVIGGHERIHIADPVGYGDFALLLGSATVILTDSGGIQEEAPSLGVPVLVARGETERVEGVRSGVARLVGTDEEVIYREAEALLFDEGFRARMASAVNPYGDGHASIRIVQALAVGGPDGVERFGAPALIEETHD